MTCVGLNLKKTIILNSVSKRNYIKITLNIDIDAQLAIPVIIKFMLIFEIKQLT